MKRCPNCGKKHPDDASFCSECGTLLSNQVENYDSLKGKKTEKKANDVGMTGRRTVSRVFLIIILFFAMFAIGSVTFIISNRNDRYAEEISEAGNENQHDNPAKKTEVIKYDSKDGSDNSPVESGRDSIPSVSAEKESEDTDKISIQQVETVLPKIDNALSRYIGVLLMTQKQDGKNQSVGDSFTVQLSEGEKIRASTLASAPDGVFDGFFRETNIGIVYDESVRSGPNGGGYHGLSVSDTSVERFCRSLFGTEANWEELQTKGKCHLFDAVKYTDGSGRYAMLIDSEMESETDQTSLEYHVRENNTGYLGEVDLFWGYWGELKKNPGVSNYRVSYELIPDDASEYGIVITAMSIMRTGETETRETDNHLSEVNEDEPEQNRRDLNTQPFYGVWCYASKDFNEAQMKADELSRYGLSGRVYISCDWSNLNQERWFCASAGASSTVEEAEVIHKAAVNAGYSDAYIKYSGEYIG